MESPKIDDKSDLYDLKKRKIDAKNLMNEYLSSKEKNENILDKIIKLDNTIPEIYLFKLKNSDNTNKLKERSFDMLNKEVLKEFNIKKKIDFKELYFEIIEYIESIILDETENSEEDFDSEEFSNSDSDNEEINSENFTNDDIDHKNDLDENLSDSEFKEVLEKKENIAIKKILVKNEVIKVKDIRIKFDNIFEALFTFSNFKNNYPDFESEFYYFNSARYMLETYKELNDNKFIKKIEMTDYISNLTSKIKNHQINNELVKRLYYYIMNTQYDFDEKILKLLIHYNEKEELNFLANFGYFIKDNKLYDINDKNKIVLENADDYLIDQLIKDDILKKKNKSKIIKKYYSLKGLLKNLPFKKDDGDKFWDEFLSSNILNDIVKELYKKENIFNQQNIKILFKENSFYFPNFNESFLALSHKELFNMYFPPCKIDPPVNDLKNSHIIIMIEKAVDKIEVQHEWGHTSSSFLFFISKIKYFETPKRKIKSEKKIENNKKKIISEGGKALECLLYGRVIKELNAKEAIFILNSDNYNLSLSEFQQKFMDLENQKLSDVFAEAIKNPNTNEIVKEAFKEYEKKEEYFKNNLEDFSFKAKPKKRAHIDLEKIIFEIGKNNHIKHSSFIKKKIDK